MADLLPLSKTLDPLDFSSLYDELQIVDRFFTADRPQHDLRRWEYALALHAIARWRDGRDYRYPRNVLDVGGAGSPFWRMIYDGVECNQVQVIDPDENCTLADYIHQLGSRPHLHDVVTCLSVLEHVDDLDHVVYHLGAVTAPGGLLFFTVDFCSAPETHWPTDRYHFHWMRKRIFNAYTLAAHVTAPLWTDFRHLGPVEYTYHGDQVYDYTFASLCLVKRS